MRAFCSGVCLAPGFDPCLFYKRAGGSAAGTIYNTLEELGQDLNEPLIALRGKKGLIEY